MRKGPELNQLERHIVHLARKNICRKEILRNAGEGMFSKKEVQKHFTRLKEEGIIYPIDDVDKYGERLWGAE